MADFDRTPWTAHDYIVLNCMGSVLTEVIGENTEMADDEAHARLFAAAPELLAALEGVLPMAQAWADGKSSSHPDHEWVEAAEAALAKAEGIPR